jgi:hypothetical protein
MNYNVLSNSNFDKITDVNTLVENITLPKSFLHILIYYLLNQNFDVYDVFVVTYQSKTKISNEKIENNPTKKIRTDCCNSLTGKCLNNRCFCNKSGMKCGKCQSSKCRNK